MSLLWIRKNTKIILYATIGVFVLFIFAVWGAQMTETRAMRQQAEAEVVAKVYDLQISGRLLSDRFQGAIQNYRERYRGEMTDELLLDIRNQTLDSIIEEALINEEASRLGLEPSDLEVKEIMKRWLSGGNQEIDPEYLQQLRENPRQAAYLDDLCRDMVRRQKIQQWISESIKVSPFEAKARYQLENEKTIIKGITLRIEKFRGEFDPEEEAVKAYYQEHADEYERPVRRRISYTLVGWEDFAAVDADFVSNSDSQ